MLQVIISPAKQMRAARDAFEVLGIPPFVHETARLHRALLDIERNEGRGEVTGECGIVEIAVSQDGPELMQGVEERPQQFVTHVP